MHLADFPRPPRDNGLGWLYCPEPGDGALARFARFLPRLQELGARWLVLPLRAEQPVPPQAVAALRDAGIEPVLWYRLEGMEWLDRRVFQAQVQLYARLGVHYVAVYDAPNLRSRWPAPDYDRVHLPQRLLEYLLPLFKILHDLPDIVPVLPPFAPAKEARDWSPRRFLRETLEQIQGGASSYLLDKLAVGVRTPAGNYPLDWGRGGPKCWPAAQGERTPEGSEDERGACAHEWVQATIHETIGRTLPLLTLSDGVMIGAADDPTFPGIDEALHAQRSLELARRIQANELPDYILNHAFDCLWAPEGSAGQPARWFTPEGAPERTETVEAFRVFASTAALRRMPLRVPAQIRVLLADGSVQAMDLEAYLRGVVAAEMEPRVPLQALKAQAIASRSLAVYYVSHPQHAQADVCAAAHCQTWRPAHDESADCAVSETEGVVALHGGEPIRAFFFAHCDGRTRASAEVWIKRLPYAESVRCIKPFPNVYGHGVGLCQAGAITMAEQGATAAEILRWYFAGIELSADPNVASRAGTPALQVETETLAGPRSIAGDLGIAGLDVWVRDLWGRTAHALTGDAPHYGPGGFLVPVNENGYFEIELLGFSNLVPVQDATSLIKVRVRGTPLQVAWPQWIQPEVEATA